MKFSLCVTVLLAHNKHKTYQDKNYSEDLGQFLAFLSRHGEIRFPPDHRNEFTILAVCEWDLVPPVEVPLYKRCSYYC